MISKYKPIVDYVEGKITGKQFHDAFLSDKNLQKILKKRIDTKYTFLKKYNYNLYDFFTMDFDFANKSWSGITMQSALQGELERYLDCFSVPYTHYPKYEEDCKFLLSLLPTWLDIDDDEIFQQIMDGIPADLPKTKRIAMGKAKIKEMFRYDKTYPRWEQEPEWPIVNGKPLVFSHQQKVKGDDFHFCYFFYNPDTKEETVVEQFG